MFLGVGFHCEIINFFLRFYTCSPCICLYGSKYFVTSLPEMTACNEPLLFNIKDLLFLVRDWSDPDISFGFEGGNLVLSKILEVQRQHKDLESVRQNIYESFTNVKCFLMPPPGRAIALRGAQTHPPLLKGALLCL